MSSDRPRKRIKFLDDGSDDLLARNHDSNDMSSTRSINIEAEDANGLEDDRVSNTPNPRTSGRQRRAPRKLEDEMTDDQHKKSKRKIPTPRKAATPRTQRKQKSSEGGWSRDGTSGHSNFEGKNIPRETKIRSPQNGNDWMEVLDCQPNESNLQDTSQPLESSRESNASKEVYSGVVSSNRPSTEPVAVRSSSPKDLTKGMARRMLNYTDNTENSRLVLEDDFEDAIRHVPSPSFKNNFWTADEHRSAETKKSLQVLHVSKSGFINPPLSNLQSLPQHEAIKHMILEKLTGKRCIRPVGMDEEYEKVHTLVEQTVLAGEGNSMLLIGARGCGKSALVNTVLTDLSKESREQYHVIRLNGFIQTDDKLALREIWRQLGQEMDVDDDEPNKNYADTLATLLALLSHHSDAADPGTHQVATSVIFVIDEFDLFTTHSRQTLLYNLFDIAQSRKAPIAVLGLTTRVNVVESLEKRVKSRFSHRYVYLSLPKSLPTFNQICKSALQILPYDLEFVDKLVPIPITNGSDAATSKKAQSIDEACASWNESVTTFLDAPNVTYALNQIYHTSKSVPAALMAFHIPVALSEGSPLVLDPESFKSGALLQASDSKLSILPSLSSLALALLICGARLDIILDTDTCNFNMVYDEYSTLAGKARLAASTTGTGVSTGGRVWGQEVARSAWEKLVEVELLIPAVGTGSGLGVGDMVRCDVALEEIEGAIPDMDRTLEKWCREI